MKKTSKLLWVLLSVLLAMGLIVGCGDVKEPAVSEPEDPDGWQTVWVPNPGAPGSSGWVHFHVGVTDSYIADDDDAGGSLQIRQIFLNDRKTKNGATTFVDFTSSTSIEAFKDDQYALDNPGIDQFLKYVTGAGTADGMYKNTKAAGEGSVHTAMGSNTIGMADYIGFMIKKEATDAETKALLGNARLQLESMAGSTKWIRFADLLAGGDIEIPEPDPVPMPPAVEDWTRVSVQIPVGTTEVEFHIQNGNIGIQEIFISDTEDGDAATVLFDFTQLTWASVMDSSVQPGTGGALDVFQELWVEDPDGNYYFAQALGGYGWGGKFKSSTVVSGKYINFIIASEGLGATRLQFHGAAAPNEIHFANILPVAEFVTVYQELYEGIDYIRIHGQNGSLEIEKIFVADDAEGTNQVTLFDFTKEDWEDVVHSTVIPGGDQVDLVGMQNHWTPGKSYKIVIAGYAFGGTFKSDLLAEGKFIGFSIDSKTTGGGDPTVPGGDGAFPRFGMHGVAKNPEVQFKALILGNPWVPGEEEPDYGVIVANWTTVEKAIPADGEIFGLHVNTGVLEIQKIYLINDEDEETVLFDFAEDPVTVSETIVWGGNDVAAFADDGAYVLASDGGYLGGGRFYSTAFSQNVIIAFVIKSEIGLGDARYMFETTEPEELETTRFDSLLDAVIVEDWTPVYFELPGGGLHFKVGGFGVKGQIEIQKVFINATKTIPTDPEAFLADFTMEPNANDPPYADGLGGGAWFANGFVMGVSANYSGTGSTEGYMGNCFAGVDGKTGQYIGFIIKSTEGLGNARVQFGDDVENYITFAEQLEE